MSKKRKTVPLPPPAEDYDFAGVFVVDIPPRIVVRHPVRVALDALPIRPPSFASGDATAWDDDE